MKTKGGKMSMAIAVPSLVKALKDCTKGPKGPSACEMAKLLASLIFFFPMTAGNPLSLMSLRRAAIAEELMWGNDLLI